MNLKIIATPEFTKSVKKLFKKYKLIFKDLEELKKELLKENNGGIELGNNCFKIRVANSSIPVGKSSGFRVIYYTKIENKIYLLQIYSKSDMENISDEKIMEIYLL